MEWTERRFAKTWHSPSRTFESPENPHQSVLAKSAKLELRGILTKLHLFRCSLALSQYRTDRHLLSTRLSIRYKGFPVTKPYILARAKLRERFLGF